MSSERWNGKKREPERANIIKNGTSNSFRPTGSFDATSRKSSTGEGYDVYARYVGENGEHA